MIKDPAIIRDELINHIPISPSDFYENCHLKYFISKDNDISFSTGGKFISRCNNHILLKNNGSPWRIPIHIYNKGGDIKYSTRFFILEDEFNQKKDISEELIRLNSHVELFNTYFDDKNHSGKKMNFLLQEMNREVNTIGSKSQHVIINHMVVDIKDELEKIREQVQNIL